MDEKIWSKDWANFDWEKIEKKLFEVEKDKSGRVVEGDIGITKEEFMEYFCWLFENEPVEYEKAITYMIQKTEEINRS